MIDFIEYPAGYTTWQKDALFYKYTGVNMDFPAQIAFSVFMFARLTAGRTQHIVIASLFVDYSLACPPDKNGLG